MAKYFSGWRNDPPTEIPKREKPKKPKKLRRRYYKPKKLKKKTTGELKPLPMRILRRLGKEDTQ